MAITPCPIFKESESPSVAALILPFVSGDLVERNCDHCEIRLGVCALNGRVRSALIRERHGKSLGITDNVVVCNNQKLESFCPTMMPEPLLGTS